MVLQGRSVPLPEDLVVHRVFEAHARLTPDRTALTCGPVELSYAELNERANRLAHHLIARGAGPGRVVGICLDRTPELLVGILATLKAGAAYVPLDPTYPTERLGLMVAQLDRMKLAIVAAETRELLAASDAELLLVDSLDAVLAEQPGTDPEVEIANEDLCYVVFTSGSTGTPKATAVRHSGWYNLLEWLRLEYHLDGASSGLTVSAFGFDISQRGLMSPLFCGSAIHLLPSRMFDPDLAYRIIAERGVKQLHCAPSTLYVLIEQEQAVGGSALTRVGHVFIGGEALRVSRVRDWATQEGNTCVLLHQYGVAECTDVASSHTLADYPRYQGAATPAGPPVYNTEIRILDEELAEVPDGEPGEICISGISVSAGYLNATADDSRRFTHLPTPDGPIPLYRTGDRGYATEDGEVVVLGRVDAQVKIRGMRMDLGDVEHHLRALDQVRDVAVLGLPDETGELALVAFVLPAGSGADARDMHKELRQVLPLNMIPQRLVILDALPLNPNGKVDRRALAAMTSA